MNIYFKQHLHKLFIPFPVGVLVIGWKSRPPDSLLANYHKEKQGSELIIHVYNSAESGTIAWPFSIIPEQASRKPPVT